jgi:hypothetical protein
VHVVDLGLIKAYDGIIGNEAADKLAKAGGCLTSVIGQGLLAKSAVNRELKEAMLAEWTLAWKSASEGRQTKVCNRVRDRYEDEVAHTLAQQPQYSLCGRQLCKQHERSNM